MNQSGGLILSDFKTYHKAIECKTVWYWHNDRNIDQWNWTGAHKWIYVYTVNWSSGRMARIYNREMLVSLTNGVGGVTHFRFKDTHRLKVKVYKVKV